MAERSHRRAWTAIAVALFVVGAVVALGMLVPSILLATDSGREFTAGDALMPLLAAALFALAGVTALKIGPRLTAKPDARPGSAG